MNDEPFLPRRRSVRLKDFDYSQSSAYFLTICAKDTIPLFGKLIGWEVRLNLLSRIVDECWLDIPNHFSNVELAAHIVMPNHIHGIVIVRPRISRNRAAKERLESVEDGRQIAKVERRAWHAMPLPNQRGMRAFATPIGRSIPTIVGAFKAAVSRHWTNSHPHSKGSVWQRGYYEHVIRDADDFRNTCEYIRTNPARKAFKQRNR